MLGLELKIRVSVTNQRLGISTSGGIGRGEELDAVFTAHDYTASARTPSGGATRRAAISVLLELL